ncbi:hypothetical protein [Actinobacillus seminis]|uniref:hypothetical protein n=1 Tax=Actinobacillus seminis TaxID=722 RepID=UPI0013037B8C|nr:hypothetical protein [Actinobacillus seminis]
MERRSKDHEIQPTAIGLKVVPQDQVFVDIDHLETVFDLASKGLNAEKNRILEQ